MGRGGRDGQAALRPEPFGDVMFAPPHHAPPIVKDLLQSREAEPEPENLQFHRIIRIAP
jgi:hypothetical protein